MMLTDLPPAESTTGYKITYAPDIINSGNPKFDELIREIVALHAKKNHDYAEAGDPLSNFKRAERLGIAPFMGVLVRMTDKWSRIEELVKGKTPKNESLRDSLIDNAVYSLLAVLLLDEAGR